MESKEQGGLELIVVPESDSTNSIAPVLVSEEPKSPIQPVSPSKMKQGRGNPQGEKVLGGRIVLNPGISPINYYASLAHTITAYFNLTISTTLQPLILLDSQYYNVDPKHIGFTLSELVFMQTMSKIFLSSFYGYLMDNAGRKPLIILGGFIALLGYLLVPFQTTVFPGYALCKLLVANGANILSFIPLNADYIHDVSKGKATGITQAFSSGGSFLGSIFVTIMIALKFNLAQIHVATGIIVIVSVMIYSMGIKGGKYFLVKEGQESNEAAITNATVKQDDSFITKMKKGMKALSSNGWLLITLVISTLARADYYLVTIVFALYIKSYDTSPLEKDESNHLVSMYQDLFFALGLIGNLIYGYLLDKVNPMKIIFPALAVGTMGYILVLFADTKSSPLIPILVISAGIAMPALFNAANYLGIKNYPRDLRGVISGLLNIFGVVGYLFLSTVGGYLFDHHGRSSPFFLFVLMLVVSTLIIIYIYRWLIVLKAGKKKRSRKSRSSAPNNDNSPII